MRHLLGTIARRVPPVARILRQRNELWARLRAQEAEIRGLRDAIERQNREVAFQADASARELQAVWDHATRLDAALQANAQAAQLAHKRALELDTALGAARIQAEWTARTLLTDKYRRLRELADRHPSRQGSLTESEFQVFSQNGEDGVIAEILRRITVPTHYFVEFGLESGVQGNCVFLADVMNWRGLFMESEKASFEGLRRKYGSNDRVSVLEVDVTPANINALLRDHGVPEEPAVLSIDIDGNDYWVWEAIECVRPCVVVIEYNSTLSPDARLVQPYATVEKWDATNFYGASLGALCKLAAAKEYSLVHCELAGVNAFFVRGDLAGPFGDPGEVPRRGPNILLVGGHHPPDPRNRTYVDLDAKPLSGSPASGCGP